jgi:UDP-glucose 4-epimerase
MAFCIVTGVAGFIGSWLAETLLREGHEVAGIDCFTDYYSPSIKRGNVAPLLSNSRFSLHETDLASEVRLPWSGVDYVFHLAAQPGVRTSWGAGFEPYVRNNILATQKFLEALKNTNVRRVIFASSSSVYGLAETLPVRETEPCRPISPYGVSKLAAEQLCGAYLREFGVPITMLRFFTVYGPRQRPDMAFHKFMKCILEGRPIQIYGSGDETRDYTFVSDVVASCIACMRLHSAGQVFNVSGGSRTSLNNCVEALHRITGLPVRVERRERRNGDPRDTHADSTKAHLALDYRPTVALEEGLEQQWRWIRVVYQGANANVGRVST